MSSMTDAEYNVGDFVEAKKGRNVYMAELAFVYDAERNEEELWVGPAGSVQSILRCGYTVTVVHKADPPIPITDAEAIQAAIDKLTALKLVVPAGVWANERNWVRHAEGGNTDAIALTYDMRGSLAPDIADLIVTLHRTIDAQLAILAANLDSIRAGSPDEPGAVTYALILAAAILGGAA